MRKLFKFVLAITLLIFFILSLISYLGYQDGLRQKRHKELLNIIREINIYKVPKKHKERRNFSGFYYVYNIDTREIIDYGYRLNLISVKF